MASGRMYKVVAAIATVTTAQDLLEIASASGMITIIHNISISQPANETSEQIEVSVDRATTSGSGGGTATPRPTNPADTAFAGVVETDNSSPATTLTQLILRGFNVLTGLFSLFTPEQQIVLGASDIAVIRTTTTIASTTLNVEVELEELG